MRSDNQVPGLQGVIAIAVASIVVTVVITVVTGQFIQWFALAAALIVGYWTVGAINGH